MKSIKSIFTITTLSLVMMPYAWGIPITITNNLIAVRTFDDAVRSWDTAENRLTTFPNMNDIHSASGSSVSSADVAYTGNATSADLSVQFTQQVFNQGGDQRGCCDQASIEISTYFTADEDATYSVDGMFNMTHYLNEAPATSFSASLMDLTTLTTVFHDYELSYNTINESFVLDDVPDGDYANEITGSLTGSLISGHDYHYNVYAAIESSNPSGETRSSLSAIGNANLNITSGIATSVPEPPTILLVAAGLLAFVRKQKNKM